MESATVVGTVPHKSLQEHALWVMVRVSGEHLVLPSALVLEMVRAPATHAVPFAPDAVRGVAPLRGQVGLVVDMRRRFGLESLQEEQAALTALLHAREKDHRLWLEDLEDSVRERRPFTRTLDPHACAFGQWYDAYQAPTLELAWHLRQFAEPHGRIHAQGAIVAEHMKHGRHDEAMVVIDLARKSVLGRLIDLFEGARHLVTGSSREIAVIVNVQGRSVGLVVDEVEGIDQLKSETFQAMPDGFGSEDPAIIGTVRTRREDKVVVVLDVDVLTRSYAGR